MKYALSLRSASMGFLLKRIYVLCARDRRGLNVFSFFNICVIMRPVGVVIAFPGDVMVSDRSMFFLPEIFLLGILTRDFYSKSLVKPEKSHFLPY